ncbi:MAG: helix-turn-helix domain-containing protein [Verrucomicrobiae bacterium]|nr:helix-turn-helix domain-containing protein [Verrucomicrobiae bacterium]
MPRRFRNVSGPEIRRHRMAQELSQDQLAARLQLAGLDHLDRVALAKIESQIRSVFDWELAVIADVLGVEVSGLLPPVQKLKPELNGLIAGKRDKAAD